MTDETLKKRLEDAMLSNKELSNEGVARIIKTSSKTIQRFRKTGKAHQNTLERIREFLDGKRPAHSYAATG